MRAATWPLSSRIARVPVVAVYLMSRPSMRTVCIVCEIFSSAGPAVSTRGAASVAAGAGVCDGRPRPCANAGAPARANRMHATAGRVMDAPDARLKGVRSAVILLFVLRAAARLRDVFLPDTIDVELRGARGDPVEGFVEVERRRLREPRVVHARDGRRRVSGRGSS